MSNYFWLILLWPVFCDASVLGAGEVELSISAEKEGHNVGIAGSYGINSVSPRLKAVFASQVQLGTNSGRSMEEVAAHDYQYENSYIKTSGELAYLFPIKSIKWHGGYNTQTDFIQDEKLDSKANSNLNEIETETEASWSVTTGPSLSIDNRRGLLIESSIYLSSLHSKEEIIFENNSSISLKRAITSITELGINSSRVCSRYNVASDNNICRMQYNGSFSSKRKSFDISMEAGISNAGDLSTTIYAARLNYAMNRYSNINISSKKSVSTILNHDESIFSTYDYIQSTLISSKSIAYNYKQGGKGLSLLYSKQDLTSGENFNSSTLEGASINSRLPPVLCTYCILSLNHNYSSLNKEIAKNVSSVSITKINSRNFSTSINFSRTRIKSELDVWSIGMLFKYNGRQAKLGGR